MYKKRQFKLISKFTMHDFYSYNKNNLSSIFWSFIFNRDNFKNFLFEKYIPYKVKNWLITETIISDIKFCLSKIDKTKNDIDLVNKNIISSSDLFFSYLLFNKILSFYNDYYSKSNISISLSLWLKFNFNIFNNNFLLNNIDSNFKENDFIIDIFKPIIDSIIDKDTLYVLKIFWPDEIIQALIFSNINSLNKEESKILLDLSESNEQFDFTSWDILIKVNSSFLSKYIDFFVLYRDYWKSIDLLLNYLNNWRKSLISNIISIENWIFNYYKFDKNNTDNSLIKFTEISFSSYNKIKVYWQNSSYQRMFPYKCYWSKCNFCAINSQNSLDFNSDYSYDFFINKWIEYIKQNNLFCITFTDEAIPPLQIINFAKKVIENKLNINYQFRTRFDKLYTFDICELLYKSWARYCWIGLESASDRLNEEIWNKWESHISLRDKSNIINNFNLSWISFHNYSIMWFPTELKHETLLTYIFLIKNIKINNFYTCTPNIYNLMKWTEIYNNLDKYWISIENAELDNIFNLRFNFEYLNWDKRNIRLYSKLVEKIHVEQFTPWLKWVKDINAKWFWDYIDRSWYFYKIKMIFKNNPFLDYKNINDYVLSKDLNFILNQLFKISDYIQITNKDNNVIYIYDWVNQLEFKLPIIYIDLIKDYNITLSLLDNINLNNIVIDENILLFLVKNRILININN